MLNEIHQFNRIFFSDFDVLERLKLTETKKIAHKA